MAKKLGRTWESNVHPTALRGLYRLSHGGDLMPWKISPLSTQRGLAETHKHKRYIIKDSYNTMAFGNVNIKPSFLEGHPFKYF